MPTRTAYLHGARIGLACRPLDSPSEAGSAERDVDEDFVISREQEAISVDEAIISLARAVFSESGTLVFEDHPLLTPLIEEIALEYWQVAPLEPSEPDRKQLLNPGLLVVGHPRSPGEDRFAVRVPALLRYTPEVPEELDAVVFVANQRDDFRRWSDLRAPRKYVISSAGGSIRETGSLGESIDFDEELWGVIQKRRVEMRFETASEERDPRRQFQNRIPELRYAIYPLLMHRIVEDTIKGRRR